MFCLPFSLSLFAGVGAETLLAALVWHLRAHSVGREVEVRAGGRLSGIPSGLLRVRRCRGNKQEMKRGEKNIQRAECKAVFKPEGRVGERWMLSEVKVSSSKESVTSVP